MTIEEAAAGPAGPKVLRLLYFVGAGCKCCLIHAIYLSIYLSSNSNLLFWGLFGSYLHSWNQQVERNRAKINPRTTAAREEDEERFSASKLHKFRAEGYQMIMSLPQVVLSFSFCVAEFVVNQLFCTRNKITLKHLGNTHIFLFVI